MPRGGRRGGKPGKAYQNRTDLSVNKGPQPVGNFAPGQPYGTGVALERAQQQVPVSGPPTPSPAAPPEPPPALQGLLQGAMPVGRPPGAFGDFTRPTERPLEPITHGLPTGPGGGPEVMMTNPTTATLQMLQQLANQPYASDDIRALLGVIQRR